MVEGIRVQKGSGKYETFWCDQINMDMEEYKSDSTVVIISLQTLKGE